MSEHFCYIVLHEDYVNFGFNQGADLPDPKGLLEGPGKMPRHTKIAEPEDLEGTTTDVWLARWETVGAHNSAILLRPCS